MSHKDEITAEETDIKILFERHSKTTSVGFAHCISGDFGSPGHMSRGVVVAFKETFGQPQQSDLIDTHLTIQSLTGGASVFGLVTKATYHSKPVESDYNTAFDQLTHNFMEKRLRTLICSPMGCTRDRIPPEDFIIKLVEFQKTTGAKIIVASRKEDSAERPLHNGLTHAAFVTRLRHLILSFTTQKTPLKNLPKSPYHEPQGNKILNPTELIPSQSPTLLRSPPKPGFLECNPQKKTRLKLQNLTKILNPPKEKTIINPN